MIVVRQPVQYGVKRIVSLHCGEASSSESSTAPSREAQVADMSRVAAVAGVA
jgi:hypothetical protein